MILNTNNISHSKWESFISKNSFTTPFQTPEFLKFYNSVPGISAQVYTVEDSDELLALCVVTFQKEKGIKAFFSRRAIIYGGPIIIDGPKRLETLAFLLKSIQSAIRPRGIYIETRNFNDYSAFKESFAKESWHYEPYLNIRVSLQDKSLEEILGALKYNRRREVSMSLKEGAIYRRADNISEVTDVYNILQEIYKTRVNLPLPSLIFFLKMFESEIGKIFVVMHNDKVIGGSFCLYYPGNSIFTMYYCGKRNYHAKIFPTHLAIIAAMDFGVHNGLKMIDLMGAGKKKTPYGVRDFKLQFGGEMVEHGRFVKIFNPFLFSLGKFALNIIKQ